MGAIPWFDIGAKVVETGVNQLQAAQQYNRTKKLMEVQQQNQMELNLQGQQIQLDTWEKTNYPAQVAMLKQAGLNPGLLYSKGGAGGVTGSQGGGSAASGSAQGAPVFDIMNTLAIKKMLAEIKNVNADTGVKDAQAGVIAETGVKEAESRINKAIAETQNETLKGELIKVQTIQEQIKAAKTEEQINAALDNLRANTNGQLLHNKLSAETLNSIVEETRQKAIGAQLENELTQGKISLTAAEIDKISKELAYRFTEIEQKTRSLNQKDIELSLQGFEKEMNAKYPGIMNVIGGGGKTMVKYLQNIGSALRGGDRVEPNDTPNINAVNTK